jgi:hypothetical protein
MANGARVHTAGVASEYSSQIRVRLFEHYPLVSCGKAYTEQLCAGPETRAMSVVHLLCRRSFDRHYLIYFSDLHILPPH